MARPVPAEGKPGGTPGAAATNDCTTSTRWETRIVKIAVRPKGHANQPPEGRQPRPGRFPNKGERVTITCSYGAGGAAWFMVQGGGRKWWVTGDTALLDVIRMALAGRSGV